MGDHFKISIEIYDKPRYPNSIDLEFVNQRPEIVVLYKSHMTKKFCSVEKKVSPCQMFFAPEQNRLHKSCMCTLMGVMPHCEYTQQFENRLTLHRIIHYA